MRGWGRLLSWAGIMVAIGLVPLVIGWSHIPDPVATHWGLDGVPNGNMPLATIPLLVIFMVAIALLTTSLFRIEGRPTAEAFAMVGCWVALGWLSWPAWSISTGTFPVGRKPGRLSGGTCSEFWEEPQQEAWSATPWESVGIRYR